MHIIDINGKKIEINALALAIMQADDYRHYTLNALGAQGFVGRQKAYWEDIYQQLLLLQKDG